jgi:general secretion pathway protein G
MRQPTSSRRTIPNRVAGPNTVAGMTLIELILACAILAILSSAALPLAQMTIRRQRETELRRDLREMRDAIDRYKDAADKNLIRTEVGSQGYPPDLETLVDGVTVSITGTSQIGMSASALAAASGTAQFGSAGTSPFGSTGAGQPGAAGASGFGPTTGQSGSSMTETPSKVRFLRKIPVDPMTGKADWGLRAIGDDPDSRSWGGHNLFDVYSQSTAKSIDGTNYDDW